MNAEAAYERLVRPILFSLSPEVAHNLAIGNLRAALQALDEITGAANAEEIRDAVFAQFCIGK